MKLAVCTVLTVLALAAASPARADAPPANFGARGQMVLSGERLFGYRHVSASTKSATGTETTVSSDSFSFLFNPVSSSTGFYNTPRLAFDGFVAERFSLGGTLGLFYGSTKNDAPNSPTLSFDGYLLCPRLGFAAALGPIVTLWGRAGLTYLSVTSKTESAVQPSTTARSTTTMSALTLEAPLAITLRPNFALLIGPSVDIGLGGSSESSNSTSTVTTKTDRKSTEWGLQFGIAGYL